MKNLTKWVYLKVETSVQNKQEDSRISRESAEVGWEGDPSSYYPSSVIMNYSFCTLSFIETFYANEAYQIKHWREV